MPSSTAGRKRWNDYVTLTQADREFASAASGQAFLRQALDRDWDGSVELRSPWNRRQRQLDRRHTQVGALPPSSL